MFSQNCLYHCACVVRAKITLLVYDKPSRRFRMIEAERRRENKLLLFFSQIRECPGRKDVLGTCPPTVFVAVRTFPGKGLQKEDV
ncbi:hypothetical protein L596_005889 [Steinernema carpocapsae]|uniref:Uncharacterized protein n=1 Tax=Steinernema carpocapsae TaxID=34508 RepID=A0A4U8V0J7_STECR|nr:hypothetical protein L596_005889 [Steinernema carpocapsae]